MWLALPNAMASNGVPGKDGVALKKRKATGVSMHAAGEDHEDATLPLPLSAVKKSKRASATRHESEFVSVEVGLRELQKRMASSSTLPEKTQKQRTTEQQAAVLATKEIVKKGSSGRAKIAIAAVEDGDEEQQQIPTATPKRRAKAATAVATPPQEPKTPVKTTRRTATPTKRAAAVAAEPAPPKRTVKAKTTPAKSVLDTLAQARAAAMQQQQERVQQRIRALTGAAGPPSAVPAPRRSPVLKHQEIPAPQVPVLKADRAPVAPVATAAAEKKHETYPSHVAVPKSKAASPVTTRQQTPPSPVRSPPSMTMATPVEPPVASQDSVSTQQLSSQGFIEEDDFDEDLAFLQALEEVESKLQTPVKAPTLSPSPVLQPDMPYAASLPAVTTGSVAAAPTTSLVQPTAIAPVESVRVVEREQAPAASTPPVGTSPAPSAPRSPPPIVLAASPPRLIAAAHAGDGVAQSPPTREPVQAPASPVSAVATPTVAGVSAPTPAPTASPEIARAPAIPPEMLAEYERLKRENEALRRSNELLQAEKSTVSTPPSPVAAPVAAFGALVGASSPSPVNSTVVVGPQQHNILDLEDEAAKAAEVEHDKVATATDATLSLYPETSSVVSTDLNAGERADDGDLEAAEESVDAEFGGGLGDDTGLTNDDDDEEEAEEAEEETELSQPVESHQSTIDRGNYTQYRAKARSSADDDAEEEDTGNVRLVSAASRSQQQPRGHSAARQSSSRPGRSPTKGMPPPAIEDGSETENDEEQRIRRRVTALPESSSSSSEDSDDSDEDTGISGSSALDAALRAATGKAPLKKKTKTKASASGSKSQPDKRIQAAENAKTETIDLASTASVVEPSTKRVTKKRRATALSAKDKSTLLWPSLDDFYDFVLDLTPRRVLLSDPLHLQLLRAYEKARARLPMQYPGLVEYCDVQLEAILEELLSSVRNAEEMSLHNSTRSRLWVTSISPCSNTSSHTSTVMNAALASSSSSSSLNPNVIFMESGFSGTSAAGKNDFIVTFQDHRSGGNQKSALSDFVGGDLLAMRSPAWRDHDIYAFGIVLCSSVVAVGGLASSGNGGGNSSANQDQLCVLVRAPEPTDDDADAGSRFASIMEMCLVNQRSTQWCWSLDQVHNLTTSAREFQAIKSVRLLKPETKEMIMSGIIPEILKTEQTQIIEPRKKLSSGLYEELEGKYNSSQLQAILGSISDESAISIIQGPPGTGKTKTILGVLSALLDGAALSSTRQAHAKSRIRIGASLQENSSKSSSKTSNDQKSVAQSTIRILVAAPSNAAVDELIVRLISEGVYDARQGKSYRPRIVRVGRSESLQQQRPPTSDRHQDQKSQDILKKKKWRKYASEVEEILLENLVNKHKSSFPTAKQARQSIIQNAQIVFCTLSGAGSVAMCELQSQHFDALVIDEAAQAVEASLLIPFKFQPGRIVLVGDHRQLPATVISKRLIDLGYDRSLFQRLVENGSRVFMLLQQYRMHPEISWFPSTYFYNGKLVEAPQMKEWTARKYHKETFFRPFVFYDVLSGTQSQVNGSKSLRNVNEIECILVLLTKLVVEQFPELEWRRKIGIIAPYKQQIYELRNELQRWENKHDKRLDIEVNTVDGFQGREKEVIIYSCVRTSRPGQNRSSRQSNGQSIEAFWADERRMNVAITRAKSSLWIIGNSTLLQQSAAWRALITHAKDSRRYMLEEDLSGTKRRESDADRSQLHARSRDRSQSQSKNRDRSRSHGRTSDRARGKDRARSRSRSRSRPRDRDRDHGRDRRR